MIELRCSQLPLFALCPSSVQQWEHPVADDSPEAKLGREVHVAIARMLQSEVGFGLSEESNNLIAAGWQAWKRIWQTAKHPVPEYPMELVTDTWRLHGHADVVETEGNQIWDWKSGWAEGDYLFQLRGYAACRQLPMVVGHIVWLRRRDVETYAFFASREERTKYVELCPHSDSAYIIDNSTFAEEITRLVGSIGKDYWAGGHCWRCDGRNECKARRDFMAASVGALMPLREQLPVSRENLAAAWNVWKKIERLGHTLKEMVEAEVATGGPLPGEDGTEWVFEESIQHPIRLREGWQVLKAHLSDDELFNCLDAQKSAVEAAIKKTAPVRQKGKRWMAFLEELETAGGLGERVVRSLKSKRKGEENHGGGKD